MNIFQQLFRMVKFCMAVCSTQLWSMDIFNTNISQGSVAIRLRGGKIFYYYFTSNLLISPSTKEFWKSVSIW